MMLFALAAAMMAAGLFVAGARQPRIAVFVAAILWLAYAVYEHQVASGVLCDANCNIRVDLALFFPILGIATFCALRAHERPPGPPTFAGLMLGAMGLFVAALVASVLGYGTWSGVAGVGALALVAYAVKSRFMTKRA